MIGRIERRAIVTELTNFSSVDLLNMQYPAKFSDEILDKFSGAVVGSTKNAKGTALEKYISAVFEGKQAEPQIEFEEVENVEDLQVNFDKFDTVVFNINHLSHEKICSLMKLIRATNESVAFLIVFAKSTNHAETFQALNTIGNRESFQPHQIFFEEPDPVVSDGMCQNLKFGIFCGSVVHFPPLYYYNGGVSAVEDVVYRISPENPKIGFVNERSMSIIPIHNETSSVLYIADKKSVDQFEKKFCLTKVSKDKNGDKLLEAEVSEPKKGNKELEMKV